MRLNNILIFVISLVLSIIVTGFAWSLFGAMGYSRMGIFGAELGAVFAVTLGFFLFIFLFWMFKRMYGKTAE